MVKIGTGRASLRNVSSIRTKLLLAMIPVVVLALIVMSVIAVTKVTSAQEQSVSQSVANANAAQAGKFNGQVQGRISMAETEAAAGGALVGNTSRQAVLNIEHSILLAHPDIAGSYIDYLPNAFDGRDAQYKGQPGMGPHGEFGTYWNRLGGKDNLTYGMVGWQSAAWFQIPLKSGLQLSSSLTCGRGHCSPSTVAPMFHDGKVVGVAGIDMQLGNLTRQVNRIKVLQTGYSFVVSHTGILVTYPKTKFVGTLDADQLAKPTTPRRSR